MPKKFIKTREDFVCIVCNTKVKGTGYTNHCPNCLYSKHVDVNPGDRFELCQGLMKPIKIEGSNIEKIDVIQKCNKCGIERKNRILSGDNMDAVLTIVRDTAKKKVDEWKNQAIS